MCCWPRGTAYVNVARINLPLIIRAGISLHLRGTLEIKARISFPTLREFTLPLQRVCASAEPGGRACAVALLQGWEAAASPRRNRPVGSACCCYYRASSGQLLTERTEPTQPQPHSKILEPSPSLQTLAPVNQCVSSSPKCLCPQLPPHPQPHQVFTPGKQHYPGCRLTSPCSREEKAWETVTGQEERPASPNYCHRDSSVWDFSQNKYGTPGRRGTSRTRLWPNPSPCSLGREGPCPPRSGSESFPTFQGGAEWGRPS